MRWLEPFGGGGKGSCISISRHAPPVSSFVDERSGWCVIEDLKHPSRLDVVFVGRDHQGASDCHPTLQSPRTRIHERDRYNESYVTHLRILYLCLFNCCTVLVLAQQPITLSDVEEGLPEIRADEPRVSQFSAEQAARYLDRSALNWQKTKKCATCHSNLFYMAARPALALVLPDSGEVRHFYDDVCRLRWQEKGPTEGPNVLLIVVGTGLTFNDS